MGKIALWGANGAIGHSVAAALRAAGEPYRVVGRSRASLEAAFGHDPLAEIATWDPADPASVVRAATGVDTIVYAVGVDYHRFAEHPVLMRATLDGAVAAGVPRVLLIGTVYAYGRARTTPVREDHPREPHTVKGRMRLAQEELLLAAHREGRVQGAVLRLPDFYGPGVEKSLLHELFKAAATGGTAHLFAPLDRPHEFVYVPDVGPVVARLVRERGAWGRVWHLAGAGVTTQAEMVARVERAAGRRVAVRTVGRTLLRLMGLVSPFMREMREMTYLLDEPVIMDDGALRALLGDLPKTSYDEGVRAIMAGEGYPAAVPA